MPAHHRVPNVHIVHGDYLGRMHMLWLMLILLVMPWLSVGMSTDPQFGISWCVAIATGLGLWVSLNMRRSVPNTNKSSWVWLVMAGCGMVSVEWEPSQELWRWCSVLALLFLFPLTWSRPGRGAQTLSTTLGLGLGAVVVTVPIALSWLGLKSWIPSLELLFALHALILVMLASMKPRWHWILLIFAGFAWFYGARSASLVCLLGQSVLWLNRWQDFGARGFRRVVGVFTVAGVLALLSAPWLFENQSYDSAFEQSRSRGANPTMSVSFGDENSLIQGSLAERVTQWAWTMPRLQWNGHGARAWQLDSFQELTWFGPPKRKAQRPHNEWLNAMYNHGIWTMGFWFLWMLVAPRTALTSFPLVFFGFPFERPELVLALSFLPCCFQEGVVSLKESKRNYGSLGLFFWILALVRWAQIATSLHVQGEMQRAGTDERVAWPQLSQWEAASAMRFPTDLQGNDVALFEAMNLANEGHPCAALDVLNARDARQCRGVPRIREALDAACKSP